MAFLLAAQPDAPLIPTGQVQPGRLR